MRLQKYISNYSQYSRRTAEKLINEGKVKVNGKVVLLPYIDISDNDIVKVNGKIIKPIKRFKYLAFYKPVEVLSSLKSEDGKKSLKDFITEGINLKPAGRLDFLSEGLMILSNDGDFINCITHPKYEIEKEYLLFSYNKIDPLMIKEFKNGIYIDSVLHKAKSCNLIGEKVLKIILTQGKNREIRNVAKLFNQPIAKLKRVRIGIVKLENLNPGKFKPLSKKEIEYFLNIKKTVDKDYLVDK